MPHAATLQHTTTFETIHQTPSLKSTCGGFFFFFFFTGFRSAHHSPTLGMRYELMNGSLSGGGVMGVDDYAA